MNSLRNRFILLSTGSVVLICLIFAITAITANKNSSLISAQNSMLMLTEQISEVVRLNR